MWSAPRSFNLFAAFDIQTGQVIAQLHRRKRQKETIALLEAIDQDTPRSVETIHVVCDNVSIHKGKLAQQWLARHPRFKMHHTPVHCSWMNQVEQWFSILRRKRLVAPNFADLDDLAAKITLFTIEWNEVFAPLAQSLAVVGLLVLERGQHDSRQLAGDGQLGQVRLGALSLQPLVVGPKRGAVEAAATEHRLGRALEHALEHPIAVVVQPAALRDISANPLLVLALPLGAGAHHNAKATIRPELSLGAEAPRADHHGHHLGRAHDAHARHRLNQLDLRVLTGVLRQLPAGLHMQRPERIDSVRSHRALVRIAPGSWANQSARCSGR